VKRTLFMVLGLAAACSSGKMTSGGGADAQPDATSSPQFDAPPSPEPSKVYAHSGKSLFRLDTRTNATVEIGPFGAALANASMTDLAVDKNDRMLGVTLNNIYTVDVTTGAATLLKAFDKGTPEVTSLSFVPTDLNDANSSEILVAADGKGNVLQIDPDTGKTTVVGNYGMSSGKQIVSSGDIVAVRGAGIYATVNIGTTFTDDDYLAQIDPKTWAATIIGSDLGKDKFFGLGYWGGTLYGFVDGGAGQGSIIEIDPKTGATAPVSSGPTEWYGAGVSTDAPIVVN